MIDLEEQDRAARRAAATDFGSNFVVEAGAGTGKTAVLVARFVSWCLGPGWDREIQRRRERGASTAPADVAARVLSRQLAITFTEAAAREMQDRVRESLVQIQRGGRPVGLDEDLSSERARACLVDADALRIRTLHSFARLLLSRHPFEAGLQPDFEIDADGSVRHRIAREVVLESLARDVPPDRSCEGPWVELLGRGVDPSQVVEALEVLLGEGRGVDDLGPELTAPQRLQELSLRLTESAENLRTLITVALSGRGPGRSRALPEIEKRLGRLVRRLRVPGDKPPEADRLARRAREALTPATLTRLEGWAKGRFSSAVEEDLLGPYRSRVAPLAEDLVLQLRHAGALDFPAFEASRQLIGSLLSTASRKLSGEASVTFGELIPRACRLLDRNPLLARALRLGLDQILVDEMQDTDADQVALLRFVAFSGPLESRPGLFVVGDPKQSLYGWRRADLEAWDSLVADVESTGGRRLVLSRNFRSQPAVLKEVRRLVEPVMVEHPGLQPPFRALLPVRESAPNEGRTAIEHWNLWSRDGAEGAPPTRGDAVSTSRLEARAVAADLAARHVAGTSWCEMVILLRSLTDVEPILQELRTHGIPVSIDRDRSYWRRREVQDALCLVRTVLMPADQVALVGWLRSSAVGLPDPALLPLWLRGLGKLQMELSDSHWPPALESLLEEVRRLLASSTEMSGLEEWVLIVRRALEEVGRWRSSFRADPDDRFVRRLREECLLEASEAVRWLGEHRVRGLDLFWTRFEAAVREEGPTPEAILRRLDSLSSSQGEEEPPGESEADAVRIMSIHRAKGLEFSHVALLQTHRIAASAERPEAEVELRGRRREARLFGWASPGFDLALRRRNDIERHERVRLLYVAATRARDSLTVSGRADLEEGATLETARSLSDLVSLRDGSPSTSSRRQDWAAGKARKTLRDVTWVFPALELDLSDPSQGPASRVEIIRRSSLSQASRVAQLGLDSETTRHPVRSSGTRIESLSSAQQLENTEPESRELPTPDATPSQGAYAGGALHRLLIELDPALPEAEAFADWAGRIADLLPRDATEEDHERAVAMARTLASGFLGARLRDLAREGRLVARGLPVSWTHEDPEGTRIAIGTLDLVYLSEEGSLVLGDLKGGRPPSPAQVARREELRIRAGRWAKAASTSLGRPVARVELWYLAADRIVPAPGFEGEHDPEAFG